ncbi:patatin family protein [Pontibacillus salipaludis]|uniref:patatin-like phospholipase family protein n=1 Tax=Pontibacillus salipaludis TaxID=1697394 RepID=UPI0031F0DEFD
MNGTGLVLEGGGMRGAYTAGVLDFFLDADLHFPYVVGASAGACNGTSYVARQKGRNYKVLVEYGGHPEYISYKRAITKRELFGMDFIFNKLPNELVPFDYEGFFHFSKQTKFVVGTTDVHTGQPTYYDFFEDGPTLISLIRASSSLPFIAPMISHEGKQLLDGGIADPIPISASIQNGNTKHVVISTRNPGYRKEKMKFSWLVKQKFKGYPNLTHALESRHLRYNDTVGQVDELVEQGKAFIIQPKKPLAVSRIERNRNKLHALYEQGYEEAKEQYDDLINFLEPSMSSVLT